VSPVEPSTPVSATRADPQDMMKTIGKYKIQSKIGEGGMGVVYKALHPTLDIVVAIKTISAHLDAEPEIRARLKQEARSAAKLSHKNFVTVFDFDEHDGRAFLVMEYLEGQDLKQIITARRIVSLEQKVRYMVEVCQGLGQAHKIGIIHRDIKPSNIFITNAGEVKILDLGLARVVSSELTRSGVRMGTPSYMSPEQVQGLHLDLRSDIFSAGVVFYELLSYSKAFTGNSDYAITFKIVQHEPDPIEKIDPTIPPEFSAVLSRAMAKDPAQRYQDMNEFARSLERASQTLGEREDAVSSLYQQIRALDDEEEEEKVLGLLNQLLEMAPRHMAAVERKREIEARRSGGGSGDLESR
jgi:serine/threonine-protein kinase